VDCLKRGGVIAYPTEYCFGLGCDPTNENAVRRILAMKHRSWQQGLIVIADRPERLRGVIHGDCPELLAPALASWPGPHTWLLPAAAQVAPWLKGQHPSIAVRVTAFPLARQLCRDSRMPLVSTSANRSGRPPLREGRAVLTEFGEAIDLILDERVGTTTEPSTITDAATGVTLRG
jgi:L-threonylcarbamoyladenylate synthase